MRNEVLDFWRNCFCSKTLRFKHHRSIGKYAYHRYTKKNPPSFWSCNPVFKRIQVWYHVYIRSFISYIIICSYIVYIYIDILFDRSCINLNSWISWDRSDLLENTAEFGDGRWRKCMGLWQTACDPSKNWNIKILKPKWTSYVLVVLSNVNDVTKAILSSTTD